MTDEEQIVIHRAQNGEMAAFRELVERYKKKVYYLALDFTGNHHDAEDMSQEVFLKVFTSIHDFRGDSKFSSWLYRITMNTCIDKSRRKHLRLVELSEVVHDPPATGPTVEDRLEAQSIQGHVDAALKRLAPRQRSIFILRHYRELALKEIAEILGISEGTVKAQLFRAIRKLQKELAFYRPRPAQGGSGESL